MNLRTLAESVAWVRSRLASRAGKTFGGDRDIYLSLGYSRILTIEDYRERFRRNAVAARIVEAKPQDTWRGGFDLIEDAEVGKKDTAFETAWDALDARLQITPTLQRADIVAGLGHYAIIVLLAPGELDQPLESCAPHELEGLRVYAEDDAPIAEYDINPRSPRFGQPTYYTLKRTTNATAQTKMVTPVKRVHYSRVRHIADGLLEDNVFGTPRLERVWNLLDDLEKVTGGGAEAFWNRANQGMQIDVDPTIELDDDVRDDLQEQVDNYRHKLERILRTRGTKINMLGSDVADIRGPAESIMAQISAGCGIPQRVLTGSEQGKMAAEQDSVKYYRLIEARRADFAELQALRPFVNHLIALGTLPKPKKYDVSWSQIRTMDELERADLAVKLAQLNATWTDAGDIVILPEEIREKLGYGPLTEAQKASVRPRTGRPAGANTGERADGQQRGLQGKGVPSWKRVHRAADRFSGPVKARA